MTDELHHIAIGACWSCARTFGFNPARVPSIPIDPETGDPTTGGVRQPICRDCATRANPARERAGLPLMDTSDAAYGPAEGFPDDS